MPARPFSYPVQGSSAARSWNYLAAVVASKDTAPITRLLYMTIGYSEMIYVIFEQWNYQPLSNSLRAGAMSTRKPDLSADHQLRRNKNAPAKPGRSLVQTIDKGTISSKSSVLLLSHSHSRTVRTGTSQLLTATIAAVSRPSLNERG